jgi:hypothetical protein
MLSHWKHGWRWRILKVINENVSTMSDSQITEERIDYPSMIDEAMRGVVRKVMSQVQYAGGLPGNHHFYISFSTTYPGVQISPQLKERYPEEMTIVLQHQYWDLDVQQDRFSLMLSFNSIPEKLVVPFNALTAFADPSIRFGLQFHTRPLPEDDDVAIFGSANESESSFDTLLPDAGNGEAAGGSAEVISLDAFRKK